MSMDIYVHTVQDEYYCRYNNIRNKDDCWVIAVLPNCLHQHLQNIGEFFNGKKGRFLFPWTALLGAFFSRLVKLKVDLQKTSCHNLILNENQFSQLFLNPWHILSPI